MQPDSASRSAPDTGLGAAFTRGVVDAMGPRTDPRLRAVLAALIRHLHDFAREVQLTTGEWMAAVDMVNRAGRMSDDKRNEGQLLCDVIGLESLVDDITYSAATHSADGPTSSAILGPFWRADTPRRANGASISLATPAGAQPVYMWGRVTDAATGEPLPGATVDVWQASTNGLYEQQDDAQPDYNLRGVFETDADGAYALYCLRPTPYPVPKDGPAGELLGLMDRHVFRPAHIHLLVRAAGHRPLTTQIFDAECRYLRDDCVFAVKQELAVRFVPRSGDPAAALQLEYDIRLARGD